jgi:hypothetical protein
VREAIDSEGRGLVRQLEINKVLEDSIKRNEGHKRDKSQCGG